MGKKRAAEGAGGLLAKKVRYDDGSPAATTNPSTPHSPVFTDANASIADTTLTSQSASRRPKNYICTDDGCGKAFDRPVRLEAHVRTHTNERPFACEEEDCDKAFFKSEHLKAHVQNKHSNSADHICGYVVRTTEDGQKQECGKAFTTSSRLKRHMAMHEKLEEFRCTECGETFRKMDTLQRHIKKDHLDELPFVCTHSMTQFTAEGEEIEEECGEAFPTISKLKSHENREHTGDRYFCDVCHPPWSSAAAEGDPDATMAGFDRPGFRTFAELQVHNKEVHPPMCSICGKTCVSSRDLTAHMDIEHNTTLGDRKQRYPCTHPDCDRSFTKKGNLSVHIQSVHAKLKPFVCGQFDLLGDQYSRERVPGWTGNNGCGSSFTSKASLEGHVRTQHLDLLPLRKPAREKKGTRGKKAKAEMADFVDSPMELDQPDESGPMRNDALSQLTGHAYAEYRPIACLDSSCTVRFLREYDLQLHMRTKHGWAELDHEDHAFAQNVRFWIGGDNGYPGDEDMFQSTEMGYQGPHEHRAGDHEPFGGPPMFEEEDMMMVDPALL
ncbi:hypothetical protein LTR09_000841 [Extremus antarcticus]|uniref:C2H2-type domain-containing protein n=1 Tax=Extremus antarcticus TaxID=702011 RepID=A0AAJ0GHP8_9PEZI|nr:hypothetical protein LTR09_000841 [Extremus antarcticus]